VSYYETPQSFYAHAQVSDPGWQTAPVPGWGINPLVAGPPRVGVGSYEPSVPGENDNLPQWAATTSPFSGLGCCGNCGGSMRGLGAEGDQYKETSWGMVALAASGGIGLGLLFSWMYHATRKASAGA